MADPSKDDLPNLHKLSQIIAEVAGDTELTEQDAMDAVIGELLNAYQGLLSANVKETVANTSDPAAQMIVGGNGTATSPLHSANGGSSHDAEDIDVGPGVLTEYVSEQSANTDKDSDGPEGYDLGTGVLTGGQ